MHNIIRPVWPGAMRVRRLAALVAFLFATACRGDHLTPPPLIDSAVLYWSLDLNHHAVTLSTTAPYDTLPLAATPRNQASKALAGLPSPLYRSADPERVVVTANGTLVAAQLTNQPVAVIATLTTDNLQHVDTVLVRVVDAPAPSVLDTLSIRPIPPDSAKHAVDKTGFGLGFNYLLNRLVHAADTGGVPIAAVSVGFDPLPGLAASLGFERLPVPVADLLVSFRSSDTTIAEIRNYSDNGVQIYTLNGLRLGTVKLYASATVFGVMKADTITFRIGLPVLASVRTGPDGIDRPTVIVGAGALVSWQHFGVAADITFSDPTNVAAAVTAVSFLPAVDAEVCAYMAAPCTVAGNIPTFSFFTNNFQHQGRVFPVPGTYEYRSTLESTGESFRGSVVVVDER